MQGAYRFAGALTAAAIASFCAAAPAAAGGWRESLFGSGKTVTREFDIADFERLQISHGFQAEIRQGDGYRVTVRIDEAFVPRLLVRKRGSALTVGFEPGGFLGFAGRRPRVAVTMPALAALELSGGVTASVSGFRSGGHLRVELSGGSSLTGDVDAGEVQARASGGSRVTLKGAADDARIELSGASVADLSAFGTRSTGADLSGASTATVRPVGKLDVKASGASRLFYVGSPAMGRVELSGGSKVQAR